MQWQRSSVICLGNQLAPQCQNSHSELLPQTTHKTHATQTAHATKSSSLNLCDKHVTMQHNTTLHNLKQLISLFSHAGVYPRPCNHLHYPNFYYPHLTIFMIFFGHAHQLASVWRQTGGKVIETALGFQRNHKITVASTFLHCWLTWWWPNSHILCKYQVPKTLFIER